MFCSKLLTRFVLSPMNEIVSRVINTRSVIIPITLMYLCDVKTSGLIFSPCVFKMKFASNKRIIIVKCGTESLSWDWTFLGTEKCMSKKAVMYGCLQSFLKVSSVAKTYKRIYPLQDTTKYILCVNYGINQRTQKQLVKVICIGIVVANVKKNSWVKSLIWGKGACT